MIVYDFGRWGLHLVFTVKGSIFPQACAFAVPCTIASFFLRLLFENMEIKDSDIGDAKFLFSNYSFILGFLLVFRTQIAYSRFWEGSTILQDMRSSWLNVTSSLMAFCSEAPEKKEQVEQFEHLLVRIMSMLHCSALQEVADMENENFDVISPNGICEQGMQYLMEHDAEHRVEVLVQWTQRLIINGVSSGIIASPPPIVSRVFQELANGRMNFQAAKKIASFPFPFPYAQMLMVMLIIHGLCTPAAAALLVRDLATCCFTTFVTSLSFWSINYIAAELEMPFGDNANDLPVEDLQTGFNDSLCRLLDPIVQAKPEFAYDKAQHGRLAVERIESIESFYMGGTAGKELRHPPKERRTIAGLAQAPFVRRATTPAASMTAIAPSPHPDPPVNPVAMVAPRDAPGSQARTVKLMPEAPGTQRESPGRDTATLSLEASVAKLAQDIARFNEDAREWASSPATLPSVEPFPGTVVKIGGLSEKHVEEIA